VEDDIGQERSIIKIEVSAVENISLRVLDDGGSALSSDVIDEVEGSDFGERKTEIVGDGLDFLGEFLVVSFNDGIVDFVKKCEDLFGLVIKAKVVNESLQIITIIIEDWSPSVSKRGVEIDIVDSGSTNNDRSISLTVNGVVLSGRDEASES